MNNFNKFLRQRIKYDWPRLSEYIICSYCFNKMFRVVVVGDTV